MKMITKFLSVVILLSIGTSNLYAAPNDNLSDLINHLELAGYEVSMDSGRLEAVHSYKPGFYIKKYRGGMLATTVFAGSEYGKKNITSWLTLINQLNLKASAARYYIDSDGDMIAEGYYPGDYNKIAFSAFLDAYDLRVDVADVIDEIKKYIE